MSEALAEKILTVNQVFPKHAVIGFISTFFLDMLLDFSNALLSFVCALR